MIHTTDGEPNRQAVYTYLLEVMECVLTEREYEIVMLHCGINPERTSIRFREIGNMFSLSYNETKELYRQAIIKTRREIIDSDMEYVLCGRYRAYYFDKYVKFHIKENSPIPDWEYERNGNSASGRPTERGSSPLCQTEFSCT